MATTTMWTIDTTKDRLHTDDDIPIGRVREHMRRDASRWLKQGLTFEGVQVGLEPGASATDPAYVISGRGYRLHMKQHDGYWPVNALDRASVDDWTEEAPSP